MRARPSAVTRFGCGEMGRSGSSSTASSKSLTNALLMKRSFATAIPRPVYYMGCWRSDGNVESGPRCTARPAVLSGTISLGKSSFLLGAGVGCVMPPVAGKPDFSGGCDAQRVDHQCSHPDAVAHRPGRPCANCAATRSVTRSAYAGPQAQPHAGTAPYHQGITEG